jgi:putative glutamine amidotransferase
VTRPRIGLTAATRTGDRTERCTLNSAYLRSVTEAGGLPLVLPPDIGPAQAGAALEVLDGLIFTGGADLAPSAYDAPPHPRLEATDSRRDAFELALFRAAWARRLPVLAICRGIQLVNVALGGTLWQDLPSELPGALPHLHPGDRTDRTHPIAIVPGSRLASVVGTTSLQVNSFHHQAVRRVAPDLVPSAAAPDGVIEGLETPAGAPWVLGVQWHPEEFWRDGRAPERGLFAALVREAERFALQVSG